MQRDFEESTDEDLVATIIIYKVLNEFREEAKGSMAEIMLRKQAGSSFQYEEKIKEGIEKYKITLNIPDFVGIKKELINSVISGVVSDMFKVDDSESSEDDW